MMFKEAGDGGSPVEAGGVARGSIRFKVVLNVRSSHGHPADGAN